VRRRISAGAARLDGKDGQFAYANASRPVIDWAISLPGEETDAMIPTFDRIDHIHVYATNRNKAEQWYADVMGFRRVVELEEWAEGGGPLTLQNSSGSMHMALFEAPAQPCRSTVALSVGAQEFVAWRLHLVEMLKRPVEPEDHRLSWSLYFADPDGNPWEITSYQHAIIATLLQPTGT
jgi:catechol-2,3-dioxygenase